MITTPSSMTTANVRLPRAPERWNLYLDRTYHVVLWPWSKVTFERLASRQVARLPGANDDFLRYSPSDGGLEALVPPDFPRENPLCRTRLAVYRNGAHLAVFIQAWRPARPIPELAELEREDFCCAFQLDGHQRGLYFGLNELGEHIGLVQLWDDPCLQPPAALARAPWSRLRGDDGSVYRSAPSGTVTGYACRIFRGRNHLTAAWRIPLKLLKAGLQGGAIRFSAGRRCYRTAELVSWGAPFAWMCRTDAMGILALADTPPPLWPVLRRVDWLYQASTDAGAFVAEWENIPPPVVRRRFSGSPYAAYFSRYTLVLNGVEQTAPLAARTVNRWIVPNGWNRLEYCTAFGPPQVLRFEKRSACRLMAPGIRERAVWPARRTLRAWFAAWHANQERIYRSPGTWCAAEKKAYCLCHTGAGVMVPYAMACLFLERRIPYLQRVRATCERLMAAQTAEGWFPSCDPASYANAPPQRFEGGAFTHGQVGEALVWGFRVLRDPRYLAAARRAAAAYRWYRYEDNPNYAAVALWHLVELCQQAPNPRALARAVYYARHFVMRGLAPSGAFGGHNFYTGYGGIVLKGLAKLLRVLPARHPLTPALRAAVIRGTNQMLARRQPDGLFAGRNRKYLGYSHALPELFEVARALPRAFTSALDPALATMVRAPSARTDGLTLACLARYLAERGS